MSRTLAFALIAWLTRLAIGLGLAAIVATLLSLLVEGRTWVESLGIALVIVGSIVLLWRSAGIRRGCGVGPSRRTWRACFRLSPG